MSRKSHQCGSIQCQLFPVRSATETFYCKTAKCTHRRAKITTSIARTHKTISRAVISCIISTLLPPVGQPECEKLAPAIVKQDNLNYFPKIQILCLICWARPSHILRVYVSDRTHIKKFLFIFQLWLITQKCSRRKK